MPTDRENNLLGWVPVYRRGRPKAFHVREHCMDRRGKLAAERQAMPLHDIIGLARERKMRLCEMCAADDPRYWTERHTEEKNQTYWDAGLDGDQAVEYLAHTAADLVSDRGLIAIRRRRPELLPKHMR